MKKTMIMLACALTLAGCRDNEEGKLNQTELTLTVGNTFQLVYNGGEDCEWSSDQPLIASVNETGKVSAGMVGNTTIRANKATCEVTVEGRYHTFVEPFTGWGSSMQEVKNELGYYGFVQQTDSAIWYEGESPIALYYYLFENDKLVSSVAISQSSDLTTAEEFIEFLDERYITYSVENDTYMIIYRDIEETEYIGLIIYPFISVIYMDANYNAKAIQSFINTQKESVNELPDFNKEKATEILESIKINQH